MVDNLNPESGDLGRSEPAAAARARVTPGESTDREIALGGDGAPATVVHQWLDGETAESAARRASARDAELWAKITEETARRGRMTTPAPVLNRLMAAIPDAPPAPTVAATAAGAMRTITLGLPAALAAGAGLLAAGVALGALLF